ncbi:hypothetical protein NMG60_11013349 [Bertholletia excelsa]
MMASPSELSLDFKPQSYSMLLKSFGDQTDQAHQTQKMEQLLAQLEEERVKIDAFKRELPLCMQLLTNAMDAWRLQLQTYRASQEPRPVLEEFIPIKQPNSESSEKVLNASDKANWMTSAQIWSPACHEAKQPATLPTPKEAELGFNVSPKLALDTKQRNGGAFLPFSKDRTSPAIQALPELALGPAEGGVEEKKCSQVDNGGICQRREISAKPGGGNIPVETQTTAGGGSNGGTAPSTTQTHRKARRCWSPDLHRRFVQALQMLGGSQGNRIRRNSTNGDKVATPKQIRELMKVEGLTNDEVKSHLQKYRLHTRRPSPSPQAAGAPAPQLVVLGGIWVPPEYAAAAAAHGGGPPPGLYGAHPTTHPPPHYCPPQVPQDFYPAPPTGPAQAVHHPLHLHHPLHIYKAPPQTQSSPESEVRGVAGDRSESIEDGKSESGCSWKADSGGENGERKALAALEDAL